jgi:glucokinase
MNTASPRSTQNVLLADIGGTNARFAVLAGGTVGGVARMAVRDYRSFRVALAEYLRGLPEAGKIGAAILAAAGVVQNDRCALGDRCRRIARCLRIFDRALDQ